MDTPVNYFYLLFIALWSTFYVESWKRKQASIQYIWGLNEKEEQITEAEARPQNNEEYVFDEHQGRLTTVIMDDNKCCVGFVNFIILTLFCSLAILGSVGTIKLLDAIDWGEDK